MKVLVVLIVAFAAATVISNLATGSWHLTFSGNLAMCLMLCFTALGHFMFTKGMSMMMPGFIPFKKELVYFTGIAEIVLGAALLFPSFRYFAAIILIPLFVIMIPANINAAIKHVNYETATYDGKGISYLWLRIPMQVFFIIWVWYFAIKK